MIHDQHKCYLRRLLLVTLAILGVSGLAAGEDLVDLSNVRFNTLRPSDGSTANWYEMEIELDARPASSSPGPATGRVQVTAMLAYERPGSGNVRRWEFFRARVELVTLLAGRAQVRFYLPPEVVRRDNLVGAPEYWEVVVTGESLLTDRPVMRTSPALARADVLQGFHDKMAGEGTANDGVLQPQYLTPFSSAYPRATPSFVRRETW